MRIVTSHLGVMPTIGRAPILEAVLPGPPTTARTFSRDDTLAVYAHVAGKQASSATLRGVLRAANGAPTLHTIEPQPRETTDGANYVASLPLASLELGDYVLTFEATATKANPVSRSVSLTVR